MIYAPHESGCLMFFKTAAICPTFLCRAGDKYITHTHTYAHTPTPTYLIVICRRNHQDSETTNCGKHANNTTPPSYPLFILQGSARIKYIQYIGSGQVRSIYLRRDSINHAERRRDDSFFFLSKGGRKLPTHSLTTRCCIWKIISNNISSKWGLAPCSTLDRQFVK